MIDLAAKYATRGPRYTSYPTAPQFGESMDRQAALARWAAADNPLSLYMHIPYCGVRCLFCGCHTVITPKTALGDPYVDDLLRELQIVMDCTDFSRPMTQIALGGGTPNFLCPADMTRLMRGVLSAVALTDDAEVSIECDPRVATPEYVQMLKGLGFTRISMGLQDLNQEVMAAVNRPQSASTIASLVDAARADSPVPINMDLIYGLPRQTESTWDATLDQIVAFRPERLAVYGYAHVPWMFRHQKRLGEMGLPTDEARSAMQRRARERFVQAGYEVIGFDHYALPTDRLAMAQRDGTLHRNFMGYTTQRETDMVALGVSGISDIGGTYTQNTKDMRAWRTSLDATEPTWFRGVVLTEEDHRRREIIRDLSCGLATRLTDHAAPGHFRAELDGLAEMRADGVVTVDEETLRITERGRPFVRQVCMRFDQYLSKQASQAFSRTS
ncbi:MAG: oxygen-independent coproporphyrinogen-3 oxidase [Myxococcota bacterium]|jgi:oxygen-independent coproporphyrinogen-3 oxidase